MTTTERSFFWGGTTIGDAGRLAPIDAIEFSEILAGMFCFPWEHGYRARSGFSGFRSRQLGAVIAAYEGQLEVSNPADTDIEVALGAAIVNGILYINDDTIAIGSLPLPAAGTVKYYGVFLKYDRAAQTVRAYLSGAFASAQDLELANTEDVNYVPLASIMITSAGVITIKDQRRFLRSNGYQVPILLSRKGGNATVWSVAGSTTYELNERAGIVVGTFEAAASAAYGSIVITLSNEYDYGVTNPIVIVTVDGNDAWIVHSVFVSESAAGVAFTINWTCRDGTSRQPKFYVLMFLDSGEWSSETYDSHVAVPSE